MHYRNLKVKGSDGRFPSVGTLFYSKPLEDICRKNPHQQKTVIAIRKTCSAQGTGLSHYVLMKDAKRN